MVRRRREREDGDVRTQREEVEQVMTTVSEIMKRNWEDPEFREKAKQGRDRYYTALMKRRLNELAKGESD